MTLADLPKGWKLHRHTVSGKLLGYTIVAQDGQRIGYPSFAPVNEGIKIGQREPEQHPWPTSLAMGRVMASALDAFVLLETLIVLRKEFKAGRATAEEATTRLEQLTNTASVLYDATFKEITLEELPEYHT